MRWKETEAQPLQFEDSVQVRSLSSGWFLYFLDLSAFTLISVSRFLLLDQLEFALHSCKLYTLAGEWLASLCDFFPMDWTGQSDANKMNR